MFVRFVGFGPKYTYLRRYFDEWKRRMWIVWNPSGVRLSWHKVLERKKWYSLSCEDILKVNDI